MENGLGGSGIVMPKTQASKGFTLIELLIVVAIIGILAAIAVPNFLSAQTRAKVAQAQAELKTLANSISIYVMENNNQMIPDCNDGANVQPGGPGNGVPEDFLESPGAFAAFHSLHTWTKLTTPIAYMNNIPDDPFWPNLVYGYDGQRVAIPGTNRVAIRNWIIWSIGPDRTDSQWIRPFATYYMASNGLKSLGDIFITPDYANQYSQQGAGGY